MGKSQERRLLSCDRVDDLELPLVWLADLLMVSNAVLDPFLLSLCTLTPVLAIAGHVRTSTEQAFRHLDAQ
ncbi:MULTISPECIES: hypothetical protein [unclassified Prochlorococcus]|uniref:hypothetical protein n=1 Tax=unclassified Prochlorococcus TaxID=2627481 RepID=UPI000533BB26|nr:MULTISPECIES: hypothetical protein [unclassified Prochlorococcus]KGG28581.1 hypothetical protein EV13_1494 [Prochlorococcus sp. MIT 0702]KGG29212.1 hypothetical protein EV12_0263 [Prochlorococcus sp. MIT 0701]KGG34510.1 hypothetical protein EV14_1192 [Prochlorococcus sp. MIT 0703]